MKRVKIKIENVSNGFIIYASPANGELKSIGIANNREEVAAFIGGLFLPAIPEQIGSETTFEVELIGSLLEKP